MNNNEITTLVQIGDDRDGSPIWLIQGGAPDDDEDEGDDIEVGGDDEDEDEDEDEEDEDGEDEDEDGDKPPAKKAPAKKVAPPAKKAPAKKVAPAKVLPRKFNPNDPKYKNALGRERSRADTAERQLRELRRSNETQAETRAREAEEAAEAKYKPVAVSAAARAAFVEAKIKGDPGRGVKMLDLSQIDIYEGEAVGIDEQVAAIMEEYPEMFESEETDPKPKPRKRVGNVNPGNRKPPGDDGKKKSSAEKIAEMYEDA